MNSKKLATYLLGAVTGVGLAMGSVAFAQNTLDHHNGGMMGQTTQQTAHDSMHGKTTPQTTQGGMHGQTAQQASPGGMHEQAVKNNVPGMHGGTAPQHAGADHYNSKTHCNSATDKQDKKS